MYGTIARLRLKSGAKDELSQLAHDYRAVNIPGLVFEHIYRMDAGGNEYFMVVAFESREAYLANANSPEQHDRYLRFRELLEADPEWHDGEIIWSYPA